jgi:hypothetical protein
LYFTLETEVDTLPGAKNDLDPAVCELTMQKEQYRVIYAAVPR